MRRTLVPILLLGLAAGCSSGSTTRTATQIVPAVPWTSAKPPQVAERAAAAARCRAEDLTVPAQVKFVPRLEGGIALVRIRNAGTQACRLTGSPRVRFVMDGGPQQVQARVPTTPSQFPDATYPRSSLLALNPGEAGDVTITWDNWCDPKVEGKPHLPPRALRIALPAGGGSLDADYNAVPPCLEPSAPTTIGVSRFQPDLIPVGRRWSEAFMHASIPGQPVHGHRGGILRFRVVLTNDSSTAARFDRCPAYVQQLAPRGQVEIYRLNCKAAHPIATGKRLAFAMQLRVPRDAPLGANGVFWALDPFGARAPQVHARVTIDR